MIFNWRFFTSLIITILAIYFALPNYLSEEKYNWLPNSKVNLGLDLRGGSHLLLHADINAYIASQLEDVTDQLRKELRKESIGYKNLHSNENQISLLMRNVENIDKFRSIVKRLDPGFTTEQKENLLIISYRPDRIEELTDRVIDRSIEIIRMRIDPTGTTEPIIQKQGKQDILLQVPGATDPEQLKKVLGKTAKLTFHLVDENADIAEAAKGRLPAGTIFVENTETRGYAVVIKKKASINGEMLIDAQATFNQNSQPAVNFALNSTGSKTFADITKNHSGKRFAIVLDNKLLSAPVINEPILGGSGIISGSFTVESANELALLLRTGALPTALEVIEERTIGPSLGQDSIEAGQKAGLVGFISVIVFMTWSYGIFGIFANIGMTLTLLYILAMLSIFHATLTLPGIAGIVLTIGMAVDANVLIYERIAEELHKGASNLYAIRKGFETAFATITDSNITTLIAALLLYAYGAGAVKGFAVTLSIGILASMFSATVITKLFVDTWMKYVKPQKLNL